MMRGSLRVIVFKEIFRAYENFVNVVILIKVKDPLNHSIKPKVTHKTQLLMNRYVLPDSINESQTLFKIITLQ